MKKFWPLVMMQFRDKVDLSFGKKKKSLIQTIVFFLLKFILIAGISAGLLFILNNFMIIFKSEVINLFVIIFSLIAVLNIFTVTAELMKSLYYADDNKVLVILPIGASQLFFSKILVYYLFELKKTADLLLPLTLGFFIFGISVGVVNIGSIFYAILILLIYTGIVVLLGSLLSIPALYIYKLFKMAPIIELILVLLGLAIAVVASIFIINLIPQNIDLINQWPIMRRALNDWINNFRYYVYPLFFVVRCMSGELNSNFTYTINLQTLWMSAILLGVLLLLGVLVYFTIKPFYFVMMTKTNEFNKELINNPKKNTKHKKYVTFANKELKLSFRDFDVSGSYIAVYILVPLLLFLMNKIYGAITTSERGDMMIFAFSILLTALPYLASNSIIATLYSKEGRAAYIKKTKPINPLWPLTSKLLFNLILSIPSIMACMVIFALLGGLKIWACVVLGLAILALQYGHIFYSASLDIMNPQNEVYATDGEQLSNPNENKATVVGFIVAFIYALVAYFLMQESLRRYGSIDVSIIKLVLIAMAFFASTFGLFVLKVKAFYYEK